VNRNSIIIPTNRQTKPKYRGRVSGNTFLTLTPINFLPIYSLDRHHRTVILDHHIGSSLDRAIGPPHRTLPFRTFSSDYHWTALDHLITQTPLHELAHAATRFNRAADAALAAYRRALAMNARSPRVLNAMAAFVGEVLNEPAQAAELRYVAVCVSVWVLVGVDLWLCGCGLCGWVDVGVGCVRDGMAIMSHRNELRRIIFKINHALTRQISNLYSSRVSVTL
jgi:hypothetical protein